MFKKVSHSEGMVEEGEILFSTPFNYMFPEAARSAACLLPEDPNTITGLKALGNVMADNGSLASPGTGDSQIDAIFTYLGQFIDHDITARTDRDGTISDLSDENNIVPADPDDVIVTLRNGRRPQLDLDSVFGEGPGLVGGASTQSQILYDANFKLNIFENGNRIDLPREMETDPDTQNPVFKAIIADMRNDENLNISQLQALFLKFYNNAYNVLSGPSQERYVRARQLTRWAYQFAVVQDYLMAVCDKNIVLDVLANGPRFYSSTAGKGDAFMPLEFSVAAFRFGHSMIRPFYKLNNTQTAVKLVDTTPGNTQILGPNAIGRNFGADGQFVADLMIRWDNFVGNTAQKARKIDTKIAHDLFTLPFRPSGAPILSSLTISNLVRAYSLSIPTGQAVCDAMGVIPLSASDILTGEDAAIAQVVTDHGFDTRSPLWYYILREAAVQQNGERLGEVGSRIVAETLVGLLKQDPNSYLNNRHDPAVTTTHIVVTGGAIGKISGIRSLLDFAGAAGL